MCYNDPVAGRSVRLCNFVGISNVLSRPQGKRASLRRGNLRTCGNGCHVEGVTSAVRNDIQNMNNAVCKGDWRTSSPSRTIKPALVSAAGKDRRFSREGRSAFQNYLSRPRIRRRIQQRTPLYDRLTAGRSRRTRSMVKRRNWPWTAYACSHDAFGRTRKPPAFSEDCGNHEHQGRG